MARGNIAVIKRLIYEYLRINTDGSYGTYLSNKRYPSSYIDDEIYSADTEIAQLLIKNGQDGLNEELYADSNLGNCSTGVLIPQNWIVIAVNISNITNAIELDEGEYDLINEGGIFNDALYQGYYKIVDNKLYTISTDDTSITYIDLPRGTTIYTPSGFEPAVAFLAGARALMNRNDNPTQSQFLLSQYKSWMAGYGIPVDVPFVETNEQEKVED